MTISTQQFEISLVRFPILEAAAPYHARLVFVLRGWINVINVKRAHVGKPTLDAPTAKALDQREFPSPVGRMFVGASAMLVPIGPLAITRAKLRFAFASALPALSFPAPSARQIAGLAAVFSGSVAKAIRVHFGVLAAVGARYRRGFRSHQRTISKFDARGEPKYFDIACRRIEQAMAQPDLFVETPKPAEQLNLLDAAQ